MVIDPRLVAPEYRVRNPDTRAGTMPARGAVRPADRSPWLMPATVFAVLAVIVIMIIAVRGVYRTAEVLPPDSTTGRTSPITIPDDPGPPPR
jgi:hypothetical protein